MSDKLMIVAHPDDESLFGGAQLVSEKNWKVVCVTNGDNFVRKVEFESVMKHLDYDYEIWSYPDVYDNPFDGEQLKLDLIKTVKEKNWNKIVTHNLEGEYGHPHHKQINRLMLEIVGFSLWVFDFSSNEILNDYIWKEKLKLIQFYNSQKEICLEHIPNVKNEKIVQIRQKMV